MADDVKQFLEQHRHPLYVAKSALWQYYADHYNGGVEYPNKSNPLPPTQMTAPARPVGAPGGSAPIYGGSLYLWQYPLEQTRKFEHRLSRAVYINILAPVVDFYGSTIGKQENVIIDAKQPEFEALLDDFDGQGQSFLQFMATARTNAIVRGHTFLLVDQPLSDVQPISARDAAERGLRPYAREILPENMLNWRLDRHGAPLEVLFRVRTEVPGSVLDGVAKQELGWEYRFWNRASWKIFRKEGDAWTEQGGNHPLGAVPVVPLFYRRIGAFEGESLLKDAAKIGQLLTNWVSALDEAFETQMFALPVWKSREKPEDAGVGTSAVLHLDPDKGEDFLYVTPDTQPFKEGWEAFYRMRALANHHMGIAPKAVTVDQVEQQSGVSKEWDFQEAEKNLSAAATNEQEATKQLLDLAGRWIGAEFKGSIQYATKYDLNSAGQDLDDLLKLQTAGCPLSARKELLRRAILKKMPSLPTAVRKEIEKEISEMEEAPSPFGAEGPEPGDEEPEDDQGTEGDEDGEDGRQRRRRAAA